MSSTLRILHCLRAPAGGLFRRVHDLAKGQAELGHKVGIVCDSEIGGTEAARVLAELRACCALGVVRYPMPPGLRSGGFSATWCVRELAEDLRVDVLHGHGSKAGVYARLAGRGLAHHRKRPLVFYTPHGRALHHRPGTIAGHLSGQAERRLASITDGIVFDSGFAAERYKELIGELPCPSVVAPGGLFAHEFYEATISESAGDFIYVGEPSYLKGLDVLLKALAFQRGTFPATATIVGSGPYERRFRRLTRRLGLHDKVTFSPPLALATAFALGRCVVIPSRAESFPYVALQAAAAQMPLIATNVGGTSEMLGETYVPLVSPGDVRALAAQMRAFLGTPQAFLDRAARLQKHVAKRPPADLMARDVVAFYSSVIERATCA